MTVICWLTKRRLDAYEDGELASGARDRVRVHLDRCGACAAELSQLRQLRAMLTGEVAEPAEPIWDAFWPQVRARLAAPPAPE